MRSLVLAILALVVLAMPPVVPADGRVALVVGNSACAHGRLPNPENDAVDMSAAPRRPGFEVTIEFGLGANVRRVVDEVKERHRRHHHLPIDTGKPIVGELTNRLRIVVFQGHGRTRSR